MFTAIIEAIKSFFGFSQKIAENKGDKIPWQEPSIRSEAVKDSIQDTIIMDKRQDKDLRREAKDFLAFETEAEFMCALGDEKQIVTKALYVGDKSEIIAIVKRDYANVLTRQVAKKFIADIKASDKKYFIIRIAPQTVHFK